MVPTVEAQLHGVLAELQASEFIYEQPAFPQTEFVFKHALTQEVAYSSMLLEQRKANSAVTILRSLSSGVFAPIAARMTSSTKVDPAKALTRSASTWSAAPH